MNIEKLKNVPSNPGVYVWKDKFENVIYVGKAKNLKKRMTQYFKGMNNSYKTPKLVSEISFFEYFIVNNEQEALILERNLINKYKPKYNIKLTDDKRYPYIEVTLKDKVEIRMIYRYSPHKKNAAYYGPFPNGYGARSMIKLLDRLIIYKDGLPNQNKSREYWEKQFKFAKELLSSGSISLLKYLNDKMIIAAENEQYEIAQDIKESINALSFYSQSQTVELQNNKNIDVIAFVEKDGYLSIQMFFYRKGLLLSKNERVIEITNSKKESIEQFISQYYGINLKPDLIISNEVFDSQIKVQQPQKGNLKKIINNAVKNASDNIEIKLAEFVRNEELTVGAMRELEKVLGLKNINHILMIDNSNTNNTNPVSAIISYRNGIKQKKEYRKYSLVLNDRLADVDYMNQGVKKYFEKNKDVKPDLFIVDGGIAQVNEVKKIIPHLKVIGLVKNDKHVTDAIINTDGKRIEIKSKILLNFLRGMQQEVDRFAKFAHTSRRDKASLEGILSSIPGIGLKTESRLLEEFKTYAAIYNAPNEKLEKIVSKKIAVIIKETLKGTNE